MLEHVIIYLSSGTQQPQKQEATKMKNEKALANFIGNIGTITEQLAAIQAHMDNHMETNPEDINWGHVGSTGKIIEDLNNVMVFLGLKNEDEA